MLMYVICEHLRHFRAMALLLGEVADVVVVVVVAEELARRTNRVKPHLEHIGHEIGFGICYY